MLVSFISLRISKLYGVENPIPLQQMILLQHYQVVYYSSIAIVSGSQFVRFGENCKIISVLRQF